MSEYAIEMMHITKLFPGVVANDDIVLQVRRGEIHALLGENGAGKSTLVSILFGLYQPDKGELFLDGKPVKINSLRAYGLKNRRECLPAGHQTPVQSVKQCYCSKLPRRRRSTIAAHK